MFLLQSQDLKSSLIVGLRVYNAFQGSNIQGFRVLFRACLAVLKFTVEILSVCKGIELKVEELNKSPQMGGIEAQHIPTSLIRLCILEYPEKSQTSWRKVSFLLVLFFDSC